MRKLSAYKWARSYCIFSRATACTWPRAFSRLLMGSRHKTSRSAGLPPASQPAMWSISTLIKLTVVPNSNQKGTTSVPDCVSCCHTRSVHVCGCVWKEKKKTKTERQKKKKDDGEPYLPPILPSLNKVMRTLPRSERSGLEKWAHKYKFKWRDKEGSAADSIFKWAPDGGRDGVYWIWKPRQRKRGKPANSN